MSASLQLRRYGDGTIGYIGDLPSEVIWSPRYVQAGGIPGVLADKAKFEADGDKEKLAALNPTPMFDRDGMDVIFRFKTGDRRYRFDGFVETDGVPNYGAMRYLLAEED